MMPSKRYLSTAILLTILVTAILFVGVMAWWLRANETNEYEYVEVREYEGQDLSSISNFRENSIKGPQYVDAEDYSLTVKGLVNNEHEYTYDEFLDAYPSFKKVVTLHCVEGWKVTILWEGIPLKDLLANADIKPEATIAIFYAYDRSDGEFLYARETAHQNLIQSYDGATGAYVTNPASVMSADPDHEATICRENRNIPQGAYSPLTNAYYVPAFNGRCGIAKVRSMSPNLETGYNTSTVATVPSPAGHLGQPEAIDVSTTYTMAPSSVRAESYPRARRLSITTTRLEPTLTTAAFTPPSTSIGLRVVV